MIIHLVPVIAGFFFAVGILLLKRASSDGVNPWLLTFVCNLAFFGLILIVTPGFHIPEGVWFQPLLSGTIFFIAQVCGFLAMNRGDVSIATPVFGSKVIFVGIFTVLLIGENIPWTLWLATILTAAALAIMAGGKSGGGHHHFFLTVTLALISAAGFGCTDVMTQKWGPLWNGRIFLFYSMSTCALLSFSLFPLFRKALFSTPMANWRWLIAGALVNAFQAILLYLAIVMFGKATQFNVLYNTRALWTILLIWLLGHWFQNHEFRTSYEVIIRRVIGALMILSAVFLSSR